MTRGRGNPWPAGQGHNWSCCRSCGRLAHWGACAEQSDAPIILEIAAASDEQQMWERRFQVLYAQHPIWRTADNDGSWGLRDFLRYAGQVCGFDIARIEAGTDETRNATQPVGQEPEKAPKSTGKESDQ